MKRLAPTFCLFLGVALASCSDDGDDVGTKPADGSTSADTASVDTAPTGDATSPDTLASDAASGDTGPATCKGLSGGFTRADLTTKVTSGKCMLPPDLDTVCANDLVGITGTCGGFTFFKLKGDAGADFMPDPAMLLAGTLMCVKSQLQIANNAVITDACLSCYGDGVK